MQGPAGDIAVFWDLDTCSIHPSISGYETVNKIRALSQTLGIVKNFTAYADLVGLRIPSAFQLRSELQSSGVSLVDCPASERGSISSKTMIVDLFAHAADNPPPATLFVIAGNNDLAYAISVLRLRQYRVVLVCPKGRAGQHSQASLCLDWFRDVLGSDCTIADNPSRPSQESQQTRSNTISMTSGLCPTNAPSQDGTWSTSGGSDYKALSERPSSVDLPSCEDLDKSDLHQNLDGHWYEEEADNAPAHVELVPPSPSAEAHDPQSQEKERLEQLNTTLSKQSMNAETQRPSSAPPSYSSFSAAPSPSFEDLYTSLATRDFGPPQYMQERTLDWDIVDELQESDHPISQPHSPANTSTSTITPRNSGITPPIPPSTHRAPAMSDFLGVAIPSIAPVPDPWESKSPTPVPTPDFSPPVTPRPMIPSLSGTPPLSSGLPSESMTSTAPQPKSTHQRVESTSTSSTSMPVSVLIPAPTPRIPASPSPATAPIPVRPPVPGVVPPHFVPLVQKLQESTANNNNPKQFRPGIAAMITSMHGDSIQNAGASDFKQYIRLAEQAGIVELPGPEGGSWVALRPELYEYKCTVE